MPSISHAPGQAPRATQCDFFGPSKSKGRETDPDAFEVGWHPHRGMDICTYLIEGTGRHADSLGNREMFASPGMQWCSVGSGIEHAEGGGTEAGQNTTGFQLWLNVPAARKMDDPAYGTVDPALLPEADLGGGVTARVLAGTLGGAAGPFRTVQSVSMLHLELPPGAALSHSVPAELDNALLYVFRGAAALGSGEALPLHSVARFDASDAAARTIQLRAGPEGAGLMLFAGKRLNEPIAWRGPFVMSTQEELAQTIREYQNGKFPPKRVPWDYRRLADFPADKRPGAQAAELR